jgi:hypothetical protein
MKHVLPGRGKSQPNKKHDRVNCLGLTYHIPVICAIVCRAMHGLFDVKEGYKSEAVSSSSLEIGVFFMGYGFSDMENIEYRFSRNGVPRQLAGSKLNQWQTMLCNR